MALVQGFDRPVHDAQNCFRAVMDALARPGLPKPLSVAIEPPSPLTAELAAVALTLADHDAPLWLDAPLARAGGVREFLRFHTGARIVEQPQEAAFALVSDARAMPELSSFAQGTDAYPDRSTTIVVAVETIEGAEDGAGLYLSPAGRGQPEGPGEGVLRSEDPPPPHPLGSRLATSPRRGEVMGGASRALILSGPGVRGKVALSITPEPPSLGARLRANAALFPRGVDLLFVAPGRIVGLPRSTQVEEVG